MGDNFCVMCGEIVPEGLQVCPKCSAKADVKEVYSRKICIVCGKATSDEDILCGKCRGYLTDFSLKGKVMRCIVHMSQRLKRYINTVMQID